VGPGLEESELVTRYPFVAASRAYLKDSKVSDAEFEDAAGRVLATVNNSPARRESKPAEAVKNYAVERLVLYSLDDAFAARRYAANKATGYARLLAGEEEATIVRVCREFFPSLRPAYSVSVIDFVKNARGLAEAQVEGGRVALNKEGLVGVFREALAKKVSSFTADRKTLPKNAVAAAEGIKPRVAETVKPPSFFKGSVYSLPCVQKVRKGVMEGKRYYGAMALAIALCRDGVTKERAIDELADYARRCSAGTGEFTEKESRNAVEWVYKHSTIGFACQAMRDQGLATEEECAGCARRRGRK